ncbi:MAG: cytochrome c [Acidobacteriota bacterium]|nr:cytochrome c [Acidobacteriota bacterium]MDH3783804.1 cytochrome c [Acidobacteriota bacterium]
MKIRSTTLWVTLAFLMTLGCLSTAMAYEPGAPDGQATFIAQKCNMCHAVPEFEIEAKIKSEKMIGPALPAGGRDAEWMTGFLSRKIQLDGNDHKKEFKGTDEELERIVAWIGTLKAVE